MIGRSKNKKMTSENKRIEYLVEHVSTESEIEVLVAHENVVRGHKRLHAHPIPSAQNEENKYGNKFSGNLRTYIGYIPQSRREVK